MKAHHTSLLRIFLILYALSTCTLLKAQEDHIVNGLTSLATIVGETKMAENVHDSMSVTAQVKDVPIWKQKLYYGYDFDIYFHHDSRSARKENGWSVTLEPEIGWQMNERTQLGMRLGGTYQHTYATYTYETINGNQVSEDLRIRQGCWEITPYARYRLKTLFNDKVGIWLEGHLYAGMEFPRVTAGNIKGTDYEGLRHSVIYGLQVSPVVTYQFNKKSSFQIFFSILSLGYSGTTFCYTNPQTGARYKEYTNDVIIFSGKLRNLISNQFTPGLYGLKFGVQKSF